MSYVTGQRSAFHKMMVLNFVYATDYPGYPRPEIVRRQSRRVKIWAVLFVGQWIKSLIDNVAKLALFIKFYEYSFYKIKTKLSKYCHMGLKMQSTFA